MLDSLARQADSHPVALHIASAVAGIALAIAGAHALDSEAVHSLFFWVLA